MQEQTDNREETKKIAAYGNVEWCCRSCRRLLRKASLCREYTASMELLAETLREQSRLANARYVGGVSSYLEVLDTERQRLTAPVNAGVVTRVAVGKPFSIPRS